MTATATQKQQQEKEAYRRQTVKHKRRYCKAPGCERIVKSQGLCQRHGAKTKTCRVPGCPKQAQGNFDRMCKSHYKQEQAAAQQTSAPPAVSITSNHAAPPSGSSEVASAPPTVVVSYHHPSRSAAPSSSLATSSVVSVYESILPNSVGWKHSAALQGCSIADMPLVQHLKDGFGKTEGWHRNEERRARGLHLSQEDFEEWETKLAWMEFLLLSSSGTSSEDDHHFRYLSHAWGPDRFHTLLAQFVGQAAEAASFESSSPQRNHHHRKSSSLLLGYDDQLAAYTLDYFLGIDGGNEDNLDDILDQDFFDMESLTSGDESSSSGEEEEESYYHTCCQACNSEATPK